MDRLARRTLGRLRQTGQGMTEYIIIVALIAVAAIAVYQLFGQAIRAQMAGISQEIAGGDGKDAIAAATAAANKAQTEATTSHGLNDYNGNRQRGEAQ